MNNRLSFIAVRKGNVETFRFGVINRTFTVERHGDRWHVGVLSYPTRRGAVADVFASAERYALSHLFARNRPA